MHTDSKPHTACYFKVMFTWNILHGNFETGGQAFEESICPNFTLRDLPKLIFYFIY